MRRIEIFSAGCPCCKEAVDLVNSLVCNDCDVRVLDMQDEAVAQRAQSLGISSVPSIVVDGTLASCCDGRGPDRESLQAAGIGKPLN